MAETAGTERYCVTVTLDKDEWLSVAACVLSEEDALHTEAARYKEDSEYFKKYTERAKYMRELFNKLRKNFP